MSNQMYLLMGVFNCLLVLIILRRTISEKDQFMDCKLFSRLLIAALLVDIVDTTGWMLDGKLVGKLSIVTSLVDATNLLFTAATCWCWVQYVQYLAYEDAGVPGRKNYFSTVLFALQGVSVLVSIPTKLFYYIDDNGCYCRSAGYNVFTLICLLHLIYSIALCFWTCRKVNVPEKRHELCLIGLIIILPLFGSIVQGFFYGISMIWTCMTILIVTVYIHIQDKRRYRENAEQREQLRDALEQAQFANKSKTNFLSSMSHDMRTPMNAVIGLSDLAMDCDSVDELKDYMNKINLSGKQLLALINDTLDLSMIENGKLTMNREYIKISQLCMEGVVSAKVVAEQKGVHFQIEHKGFQDNLIYVDGVKITKLFTNLLSNAVKFTPPGGNVVFFAERLGEEDHVINYRLGVRDTGIGMSKEFLEHIFEPFSQEHLDFASNATGTGLGMTIVKEFADFLGAKLEIKSELGKGTEVTVWIGFQIADKKPEELQKKTIVIPNAVRRILVAEDHPLNAEIIKRLLTKKEYCVDIVKNGKECVSKFIQSESGYYVLILMDIRMPEMNGLEATRAIRKSEKADAETIPIIAMTANAFEQDVKNCIDAGMNAHMSKPVEPENLYLTLEQFLTVKKS